MIEVIETFLKNNINLIDENNYTGLYDLACKMFIGEFVGKMTAFLLENEVDPLIYMDEIPEHYLETQEIESFTTPKSIKNIGDNAFQGCRKLKNIDLKDGIKSIGNYAFRNCSSLTSVTIPNSLTSIGDCAFDGCSSLTSIYFKGTKIEWYSIKKYGFWNYNVPIPSVIHCTDGDIENI